MYPIGGLIFCCVLSVAAWSSQNETATAKTLYPEGIVSFSSHPNFSKYAFVVDKLQRSLQIFESDGTVLKLVAEHPTDIGKRNGAKEKQNDYKTPEGIYFLLEKKAQPEIPFRDYGSMAFTTDYPNIFDKREDKSGSGIWLHAIPDFVPLTRGSRGCVVVRDNVIKDLASYIKLEQTPLLIFNKVHFLTEEEHEKQRTVFLAHFERWRSAWEKEDVETYIKFYDPTFRNDQMNFRQWYRHKKKLKGLYKYIKVHLFPPTILRNGPQVVIRTIQRYESDLHQDYGEKTIHANYSDETGFKIIREDWRPLAESQETLEIPKISDTSNPAPRN